MGVGVGLEVEGGGGLLRCSDSICTCSSSQNLKVSRAVLTPYVRGYSNGGGIIRQGGGGGSSG